MFIITENENGTVCMSPSSLKKQPIKTAIIADCEKREMTTEATTLSFTSLNPTNDSLSLHNGTNRKALMSGIFQFNLPAIEAMHFRNNTKDHLVH